ncbi:hypothetical protein [Rhizobium sp. NXC24]|uniref:hypothetical protein n=1 Tax=Rhizobium sp. NXC24 TaxID=2048897 RepID=UPI000CDF493B|nr:hypothetical protein [Rhizobium sp. NXC24]AVA21991.1 hypothetical protein NXC24_CH02354 [Rhizobium sp. NXC24]
MSSSRFCGVVVKLLSVVETDSSRSNQHEFNGSRALIGLFGTEQPQRFKALFLRLEDGGEIARSDGSLTWYDARARHPTRSEYRLYYYDNPVTKRAMPGDTIIIGLKTDGSLVVLFISTLSKAAAFVYAMFGIEIAPGAAFISIDATASNMALGVDSDDTGWEGDDTDALPESNFDLTIIRKMQEILNRVTD